MLLKKLLKDEKGVAVIILTLLLGLFALGFIAIVVDAGILYGKRKEMITAADAAALAGAQVLRESEGVSISEAEATAIQFAIANGVDEDNVDVFVGDKEVTLQDGQYEVRQIVEVTVVNTQPLIFARFLGDEESDVAAHSIATWGYVYKSFIGNFIPLFIFDSKYRLDQDIMLHQNIEDSNSYGFIDIGSGLSDIKAGISGETVQGAYIYKDLLDGQPGSGESLRAAVEERMENAQGEATAEDRRKAMIGIIPVIDRKEFLNINDPKSNKYKLPIAYFAYYEIKDVIKKNTHRGSDEALDPNNDYMKVSTPFNYSNILPDEGAESTYIIGRCVGEKIEARTIAEIGDQVNPDPSGDTPAMYCKLIK